MKYIISIYRVVSYDQYQCKEVETNWHTSKQWCEDWLNKCSYKNMCLIENEVLMIDHNEDVI